MVKSFRCTLLKEAGYTPLVLQFWHQSSKEYLGNLHVMYLTPCAGKILYWTQCFMHHNLTSRVLLFSPQSITITIVTIVSVIIPIISVVGTLIATVCVTIIWVPVTIVSITIISTSVVISVIVHAGIVQIRCITQTHVGYLYKLVIIFLIFRATL